MHEEAVFFILLIKTPVFFAKSRIVFANFRKNHFHEKRKNFAQKFEKFEKKNFACFQESFLSMETVFYTLNSPEDNNRIHQNTIDLIK